MQIRSFYRNRDGQIERDLLESQGLETRVAPMWAGTPFANVLLIARRPPLGAED